MKKFIKTVRSHYRAHNRAMPWRSKNPNPYSIVVSEIMLQQTQVNRIMKKFGPWMKRFPDWRSLAKASTGDVIREWSGLGYNRRALYLKRIAEKVLSDKDYSFLSDGTPGNASHQRSRDHTVALARLKNLPGIGPNTAGSIMAFAFNVPIPFIETNIRSVFIHFLKPFKKIGDEELMPLIEKSLAERENHRDPRQWYYALMDYGAFLKKTLPNPSRRSAHHVRQSAFKGSNRELRGKILRALTEKPADIAALKKTLGSPALEKNLDDLAAEGFIIRRSSKYRLA